MKFSVVIPTMHRKRVGYAHIYGALYCCAHQTKPPDEIMVLADPNFPFSKTTLAKRVKEIFGATFDTSSLSIHLLGQYTIADKRNYGLDKASNDWVVFMDDDDWYGPDYLAELKAYLNAYGMPVITARTDCIGYRLTRWGGRKGVFCFVHGPAQALYRPFMRTFALQFEGAARAEDARLHSHVLRLQLGFDYSYHCELTGSQQMLHILYPDTPDRHFTLRDWGMKWLRTIVGKDFTDYLRHLRWYST